YRRGSRQGHAVTIRTNSRRTLQAGWPESEGRRGPLSDDDVVQGREPHVRSFLDWQHRQDRVGSNPHVYQTEPLTRRSVMSTYGRDFDVAIPAQFPVSRRDMLRHAAAGVVGGGAAAVLGGVPLLAQAPNSAIVAAAEAERQAPGKTAGTRFRALVRAPKRPETETLDARASPP